MVLGSERQAVQEPFLRYAQEAGWVYLPQEEVRRLRRGQDGLLLYDVFLEKVQQLNPGVVDLQRAEELAKRLSGLRPSIEGNLEASEYLKGLKNRVCAGKKKRIQYQSARRRLSRKERLSCAR